MYIIYIYIMMDHTIEPKPTSLRTSERAAAALRGWSSGITPGDRCLIVILGWDWGWVFFYFTFLGGGHSWFGGEGG